MHVVTQSIEVNASPEKIWNEYSDESQWPIWDTQVEWIKLDGAFEKGVVGNIKPKGGPKLKFEILELTPNVEFTAAIYLPLCRQIFRLKLVQSETGVRVEHNVDMTGLLAPLFFVLGGLSVRAGMPATMQRLKSKIESR